jgi:hypothetical protein
MNVKTVLYAAVGAPVVAARKIGDRVEEIRTNLNNEANSFGKTANQRLETWAGEGEKVINRITDAKVVDDLAARVDFDQVSTQVSKLRDQLEDMLSTWRSSFRPEKLPTVKVEASAEGVKFQTIPAKKGQAPKAQSSNGQAKKTTAKKTTAKAVAKKAPAKKAPAKKAATARKAPAAKRTAAAAS